MHTMCARERSEDARTRPRLRSTQTIYHLFRHIVCYTHTTHDTQRRPQEDTGGHRRHQEVTGCQKRPPEATGSHRRPHEARGGHRRQQMATGDTRRPQETPGDTRRSQEAKAGHQERETGHHKPTSHVFSSMHVCTVIRAVRRAPKVGGGG